MQSPADREADSGCRAVLVVRNNGTQLWCSHNAGTHGNKLAVRSHYYFPEQS
jgi:hypothetical protein